MIFKAERIQRMGPIWLACAFAVAAAAQPTEVVLHNFGSPANDATPFAGRGVGAVYRVDPSGHETVLHSFAALSRWRRLTKPPAPRACSDSTRAASPLGQRTPLTLHWRQPDHRRTA